MLCGYWPTQSPPQFTVEQHGRVNYIYESRVCETMANLNARRYPMMHQQPQSREMQACIDACNECHETCLQMLPYCLRAGGKHIEEQHLRLMINCAEICQTAANFMLSGSPLHGAVCAACAEKCQDMAKSYHPRRGGMRTSGASPRANI